MTNETIVYSTALGGTENVFHMAAKEALAEEQKEMEDFMFSAPLSPEEEDYFDQQHLDYYEEPLLACGCEMGNCTCEEDRAYDDNCEEKGEPNE